MAKKSKSKDTSNQIASNRKAYHDYAIETKFIAGLMLEGWEVKSLREGRVQLKESYVMLKDGEAWLVNAHFSPLPTACGFGETVPTRSRKLLLNRRELNKLQKAKDQQGYTIVALDLHWKNSRAKLTIALAKGKKLHDKRQSAKDRDWGRQKQRLNR